MFLPQSSLRRRREPQSSYSASYSVKLCANLCGSLRLFLWHFLLTKRHCPMGLFFNVNGSFYKEVVATRLLAAALRSICSINNHCNFFLAAELRPICRENLYEGKSSSEGVEYTFWIIPVGLPDIQKYYAPMGLLSLAFVCSTKRSSLRDF